MASANFSIPRSIVDYLDYCALTDTVALVREYSDGTADISMESVEHLYSDVEGAEFDD